MSNKKSVNEMSRAELVSALRATATEDQRLSPGLTAFLQMPIIDPRDFPEYDAYIGAIESILRDGDLEEASLEREWEALKRTWQSRKRIEYSGSHRVEAYGAIALGSVDVAETFRDPETQAIGIRFSATAALHWLILARVGNEVSAHPQFVGFDGVIEASHFGPRIIGRYWFSFESGTTEAVCLVHASRFPNPSAATLHEVFAFVLNHIDEFLILVVPFDRPDSSNAGDE